MNIVVLSGGVSSERDISLLNAQNICQSLRRQGHNANILDLLYGIDDSRVDNFFTENNSLLDEVIILKNKTATVKDEVEKRKKYRQGIFGKNVIELCMQADLCFICVSGKVGEDGHLQSVFDLYDINYTGSGQMSCLLSLDKSLSKKVLVPGGVVMPKGFTLKKGHRAEYVPFPCVVKPSMSGSSIGVSIVNNDEEFQRAIGDAFALDDNIIVEEYIKGREFAVGFLEGKALSIMEIKYTGNTGFNSHKNKWDPDLENEKVCPAKLDEDTTRKMKRIVEKACDILGIEHYAKADLIMSEEGDIYLLEVNSLPNMLDTSVFPNIAAADGIHYDELISRIIKMTRRYV
ncbi:D-alanine--D-alanine ligase family protein [Lachnospira multipara]|uniref:D-alanine--D-alanine ligase family protein n=1 Tax=Lachnospira multipara TaxID=28051 RepID=UPI0004E1F397|nr:ATP-grasp domain-containing protein [Lachnospira multipara]